VLLPKHGGGTLGSVWKETNNPLHCLTRRLKLFTFFSLSGGWDLDAIKTKALWESLIEAFYFCRRSFFFDTKEA
jgi:hypothetical protein